MQKKSLFFFSQFSHVTSVVNNVLLYDVISVLTSVQDMLSMNIFKSQANLYEPFQYLLKIEQRE